MLVFLETESSHQSIVGLISASVVNPQTD